MLMPLLRKRMVASQPVRRRMSHGARWCWSSAFAQVTANVRTRVDGREWRWWCQARVTAGSPA